MKNQKAIAFLSFIGLLSFPLICGAVVVAPALSKVLNNIVTLGSLLGGLICAIMIVWGGVVILTAAGAPEKVQTGRQVILYAAVGLVIILIANGLVATITSLTQ